MAKLLVSVRSASEALAAWRGGASVIDVKEPNRGPLGRADARVWRDVRSILPPEALVSVALGELNDCVVNERNDSDAFFEINYRKIGFAGSVLTNQPHWIEVWRGLRERLGLGPAWIGASYVDWRAAAAPSPDLVLQETWRAGGIGVLLDTWDKSRSVPIDLGWLTDWTASARAKGLLTAVAGRLDATMIARLAPARPDLFAVRGAACANGDRNGAVRTELVARLALAVHGDLRN